MLSSKNVGLFTRVSSSPLTPLSSALSSAMSGTDSVVSMVKLIASFTVLPATSVASTVSVCAPSVTSVSQL
ncbi:hypothetical protein SAEN8230_21375 [Salmonella enterica subsp. arizonae]